MSTVDWFKSQIAKIPGPKKPMSARTLILCPFHKEKTPSGSINLDMSRNRAYLGSFKCFGCGTKATWNELAEKFGLETLEGGKASIKEVPAYDLQGVRHRLLGTESEATKETFNFDFFELRDSWRGFSAEFLTKVGAKLAYHDERGVFYVYLPVMVRGKEVGFIRAHLKKPTKPGIPTYLNKPGVWSMYKGLFPFDYAIYLMKAKGLHTVVLVEGPRDALRLLRAGIPAMAIIGTQSWTDKKRILLERAGVEKLIFLMDGDVAGKKATKDIYPQVKDHFEVKILPLWKYAERKGLDKVDPMSMPRSLLKTVKRFLE